MNYALGVLTQVAIFGMLAVALNLVLGYGGMLALNFAALFGLGAFTFAVLSSNGVSTDLVVVGASAMTMTAFLSVAMGLPALRLQGVYFMVATFAVQMIMFDVFFNYANEAYGQGAIFGYDRLTVLGVELGGPLLAAASAWLCLGAILAVSWRIVSSPYGVALRAVRDEESAVRAAGRSIRYYKVSVFAVAGAFAALAGVLYASYIGVVVPEDYSLTVSIVLVAMVVFGGAGSLLGSVLGAALLVIIPQALQYIQVSADAAHIQQALYGLVLVVLMMWRRRGLLGEGL